MRMPWLAPRHSFGDKSDLTRFVIGLDEALEDYRGSADRTLDAGHRPVRRSLARGPLPASPPGSIRSRPPGRRTTPRPCRVLGAFDESGRRPRRTGCPARGPGNAARRRLPGPGRAGRGRAAEAPARRSRRPSPSPHGEKVPEGRMRGRQQPPRPPSSRGASRPLDPPRGYPLGGGGTIPFSPPGRRCPKGG